MSESHTPSKVSIENLNPAELLELGYTPENPSSSAQSGDGARFVPPALELLAERFPDLEILEPIGYGGMGCVFKVRQKHLDRIVALKILPAELSQDPAFADRFAREARMLAKLSHPNIVTIHDFGQADEFSYLVMEYVDGMNLREVLRTGGLESQQALAVLSALAGALDYAHAEGVVHRDIKPENILFDRRGHVKLADFGLAKLAYPSAINPTLTLTRQALGTPHYMAPEQWESPQDVDHRADIYALGVVGYEMLTGRLPVGKFDAPSTLTKLSTVVDDVIHKALHRDPAKRYQEAHEIKDDLASLVSTAPQALWNNPFAKTADGAFPRRWEAMFREWASEYWPGHSVRNTLHWVRDDLVNGAKFIGNLLLKLPWGAIAGFALIVGMINADWAAGQTSYRIRDYDRPTHDVRYVDAIRMRGFDGFETQTRFGVIRIGSNEIPLRMENFWLIVAAGGILFLAVFRPVFGARSELLAIFLAVYGIYHIVLYFGTPPESIILPDEGPVTNIEFRAAPLITGLTFAVLLLSMIWSLLNRVGMHLRESPKGERHFLRSFYESLLGLPPRV